MNETNKASMEKIVKAIPLANFKIEVLTCSGLAGIFDMKPYLKAALSSNCSTKITSSK